MDTANLPIEIPKFRLLLLEDNLGDARLLGYMLEEVKSARFELVHVTRLADALKHLEHGRFDAILSDLSVPDSQGFPTFLKCNQAARATPVIVLTSLNDQDLAMKAVQEGAQDYLVKGQVNADVLVRSIRYAIERQEASHYRALMMEREHFDAAIANMGDGILVTGGDWNIVAINHAARCLLNLPEQGWKGLPAEAALKLFELSPSWEQLIASSEHVTRMEIARPHTRPPLYLDARLARLFDPAGKLVSVVISLRDVTAEKQSQKLQSNFFSLVSHKLRTPLAVLDGYVELYKQLSPNEVKQEIGGMMTAMGKEIKTLTGIVQSLLEFKASAALHLSASGDHADLAEMGRTMIDEVRRRYPGKQIEYSEQIAPSAAWIESRSEHLALVLEKLMDNAAKFADRATVKISISSEIKEPGIASIAVSDDGPGIPHEYFDRILKGFVQVENRVTGQVPGLGIGLFLARQVVEAYGGTLGLQSQIGKGTTVSFTLPVCASS